MDVKGIKSVLHKCLFCYTSVILCSCSFIPEYEKPPLPVAETYPRGTTCMHECASIRQLSWQEFFTDPELKQLIELALKNNRDLRTAIQRMDEARALYGIQRANLYPTLSADAAELRFEAPGSLLPNAPSGSPSFIFSAYAAALSVNAWEVDFWGRLRSLNDVALENYLASEEAEHAAYISLIGQVANTYLTDRELNDLISIAQETVNNRQDSHHLIKRRYEKGSSSKLDVIEAETLLQQAKSELTILQNQYELNWNALTLLVGTEIPTDKSRLPQSESYFVKEISPGLPSELLYNRPDVLAAEHKLKAANANIGAARAAFFPAISLTGAYGSASSELQSLFNEGGKLWVYFPTISVPIFDWGRNMSDLGLAKARKNLAVTEYEHTVQVAFREVADALADGAWLEKQVVIQNTTLDAQKERARLSGMRYQHGTSPYIEVLDAEREKFSTEQALVQSRYALLASRVNLYTALGGGYIREEESTAEAEREE